MSKPYSDRRWHDNPKPVDSFCNECQEWLGFGKCKRYETGIPKEILQQSFPGQNYKENYCGYYKPK